MLLWLTLTLLWSSPCWAGRKSGRVCPLLPFPRAPLLPQPGPGGWAQPLSQTNSSLRTVPSACRGCVPSGQTQPTCHCGLPPTPTHLVLCLEMFGNGKGSYFITSKDNETGITGIRVFVGPVGLIKSIQVRYGSSWSEKYGIPGGKAHELILHPGEHIISIYGRYRTFLQHVTLITNQGRSASFGLETGKGFFAAPNLTGQVLEGVYGQFWLYGITGIGFTWGFPREGLASVLPSDDPF
uniref:Jacalin-type lectin domain-containing protein n=2 Tax=Sus scrofa TaxID=9823 RepID=A0A8D0QXE6_PIG